jgi:hypothetical protein
MRMCQVENIALVGVFFPNNNFILLKVYYCTVFMSPETAVKPPWRNIFQTPHFKKVLALVAVDEAHCIPEWLDIDHCGQLI